MSYELESRSEGKACGPEARAPRVGNSFNLPAHRPIVCLGINHIIARSIMSCVAGLKADSGGISVSTDGEAMLRLVLLLAGLGLFALVWWAIRMAWHTQGHRVTTGDQGMIGLIGRVETPLGPFGEPGRVFVHGEIWRAHSALRLPPGIDVRVTRVDGLTIEVEPLHPDRLLGGLTPPSIVDRHLSNEGEGHV